MQKKSSNFVKIKYAPSKEKIESLTKRYIKRIKQKIDLKLAIIFGSYAKNNYSFGSDIDIFLVAQKLPERILDRTQILIDPNLPIQIEPFAYTPKEFKKMIEENHLLAIEAIKNGITLYATQKYKKLLTQITF